MKPNQITKLNLESRTADLKALGKSEREIATILSCESNQKITQSCVHRYLAAHNKIRQEAIEKNDKLKAKIAELELDTVQERQLMIRAIKGIAWQAKEKGDLKTAIMGLDKAVDALESLDKRLGVLSGPPGNQVNIEIEQRFNNFMEVILMEVPPDARDRIISKLRPNLIH